MSDHQRRHMLTMRFWYTPMTPLAAMKIKSTATPHIVASTREVRISDWVTTYAVAMWYPCDMLERCWCYCLVALCTWSTVWHEALRSCMQQSGITHRRVEIKRYSQRPCYARSSSARATHQHARASVCSIAQTWACSSDPYAAAVAKDTAYPVCSSSTVQ